ncbi:MAG: cation diffusion facilitator family transporter [Calditrichia bacterium]
MDEAYRLKKALKVTWIGFGVNVILTILKLLAGILAQSAAMVADALHSLSDFGSDLVVIFGFKIAGRPIDDNHNYGHGKFETLATAFIGFLLLFVSVGMLWSASTRIYGAFHGFPIQQPGILAFWAAIISIAVKEGVYQYTYRVGERIDSQAVIANAWHHRSDALSSLGTLLGIGGAIFLGPKWRFMDPLAALVVSIMILKVGFDVLRISLGELLETSVDEEEQKKILQIAAEVPGAINPHALKTRRIGNKIAIDLHIKVDKNLNIVEAHDISTEVEEQLRKEFGHGTFVSVHIEPHL